MSTQLGSTQWHGSQRVRSLIAVTPRIRQPYSGSYAPGKEAYYLWPAYIYTLMYFTAVRYLAGRKFRHTQVIFWKKLFWYHTVIQTNYICVYSMACFIYSQKHIAPAKISVLHPCPWGKKLFQVPYIKLVLKWDLSLCHDADPMGNWEKASERVPRCLWTLRDFFWLNVSKHYICRDGTYLVSEGLAKTIEIVQKCNFCFRVSISIVDYMTSTNIIVCFLSHEIAVLSGQFLVVLGLQVLRAPKDL